MPMPTLSRRKGSTETKPVSNSGIWIRAGHYDPEFKTAVSAEIAELKCLNNGWDGYGAPPINREIIAAACRLIRNLPESLAYRPRVVPMSTGNLQLEWHAGQKLLELEFESAQAVHFLQWDPDRDVEEEGVFPVTDEEKAVELIQWFMSGTCI